MLDFAKLILGDSPSGFLKGHSFATALLKMTDDFRASLDNKDHCIATAVDLSKAFDSMRGVNRGMQIRRSVVFLGPIRRSDLIFVQIRIRVTLKSFRGI